MKLKEFDYTLSKDKIAQYPLNERDSSRLLVIDKTPGKINHSRFKDITKYLIPGDVLVLNNTRVIPARIYGVNPDTSGGKIEVLLLKERRTNVWEALVKGIKQGKVLFKNGITADIVRSNGEAEINFNITTRTSELKYDDIKKSLDKIGVMPLPPYIKRNADVSDIERYQTVFSKNPGSVAAPTAGLHFTQSLLDKIKEQGVKIATITLQVGYGTFKPVSVNDIENHFMNEESYEISAATANTINRAKEQGRRVIAVGTTATRTLEASAAAGSQSKIKAGHGKASIFIYPGYSFRIIDALITNFHLPKSTPMMLTSAFSGLELLKRSYSEALKKNYRFFSYGDAMLII